MRNATRWVEFKIHNSKFKISGLRRYFMIRNTVNVSEATPSCLEEGGPTRSVTERWWEVPTTFRYDKVNYP